MKQELTAEQVEYAVRRLIQLIDIRGITQTWLADASDVTQPTICKIVTGWKEPGAGQKYMPSEGVLSKLYRALGHKLSHILDETDSVIDEILGYFATPLTGLTTSQDAEVRKVVRAVREIAAAPQFLEPRFDIYWPGEHNHPTNHPNIASNQVYITDRTRASTHDFIIQLCASPSYGVGQENEIATQGGVPAIRLRPEKLSRMMVGSFARAINIQFSGSLDSGIVFDREEMRAALAEVRKIYFQHHALYRGMNGDEFGERLRKLIDDRCGSYDQFAQDIGISTSYLHSLMGESFAVSNPSIRLLRRIAVRLGARVSYLIGESDETDPVWNDSQASWRAWVEKYQEVRAAGALKVRDDWRHAYALIRHEEALASSASHRRKPAKRMGMEVKDWDSSYQKWQKENQKGRTDAQTATLFS